MQSKAPCGWEGGRGGRQKHQRGGAKVSVSGAREEHGQREESSASGAFTQRCHRLEGMCCVQEVVPLSEMTSPSLLETIG